MKNQWTIGRKDANQADILIDNSTVSSRHASLRRDSVGNFWLKDLKSTNGTLILRHNKFLPVTQEMEIITDDRIFLGTSSLTYTQIVSQLDIERPGLIFTSNSGIFIRCPQCAKVIPEVPVCPYCQNQTGK